MGIGLLTVKAQCTITDCQGDISSCADLTLCCEHTSDICDEFVDIQADQTEEQNAEYSACEQQFQLGNCYDGEYRKRDMDLSGYIKYGNVFIKPLNISQVLDNYVEKGIMTFNPLLQQKDTESQNTINTRATSLADCLSGCQSLNIQIPGWPGAVVSAAYLACQGMCYVRF